MYKSNHNLNLDSISDLKKFIKMINAKTRYDSQITAQNEFGEFANAKDILQMIGIVTDDTNVTIVSTVLSDIVNFDQICKQFQSY